VFWYMKLPKIFQAFKNLESNKIIQQLLEISLSNFFEEIDKREIKSSHFRRNV